MASLLSAQLSIGVPPQQMLHPSHATGQSAQLFASAAAALAPTSRPDPVAYGSPHTFPVTMLRTHINETVVAVACLVIGVTALAVTISCIVLVRRRRRAIRKSGFSWIPTASARGVAHEPPPLQSATPPPQPREFTAQEAAAIQAVLEPGDLLELILAALVEDQLLEGQSSVGGKRASVEPSSTLLDLSPALVASSWAHAWRRVTSRQRPLAPDPHPSVAVTDIRSPTSLLWLPAHASHLPAKLEIGDRIEAGDGGVLCVSESPLNRLRLLPAGLPPSRAAFVGSTLDCLPHGPSMRWPRGLAYSPHDGSLWVGECVGGTVQRIRLSDGRPLARTAHGLLTCPVSLALRETDAERHLFVADDDERPNERGGVFVLEAESLALLFVVRGALYHPTCVRLHRDELVVADCYCIHFFAMPDKLSGSNGNLKPFRSIEGARTTEHFHGTHRRFRRPLAFDCIGDRLYVIEDGGLDDRRTDAVLGTPVVEDEWFGRRLLVMGLDGTPLQTVRMPGCQYLADVHTKGNRVLVADFRGHRVHAFAVLE
ncbi:hypothetical protein AB1Y20_017652 [Prymnesium parvum]|uniref:Peptidylamidoglycolate lyase n=1 Tax=Prymnesium parvum TaxID=97485 RepID=A0AB34JL56_PRYPA